MFMMPTIDMVATGKNIERLRKVAGLSVRDLQDVFGFATPQAIYKWQHGTAMPTIDNLVVLAALLQVKIDDILVVQFTVLSGRHSVLERPLSAAKRPPILTDCRKLSRVYFNGVMLGRSFHDGISRHFIVQNHGFPVVWIPLRANNRTPVLFIAFLQ